MTKAQVELMEKLGGPATEVAGSILTTPFPGNLIPLLAGVGVGPYKGKEKKIAEKRTLSNFIPLVGPYRLGRRIAGRASKG